MWWWVMSPFYDFFGCFRCVSHCMSRLTCVETVVFYIFIVYSIHWGSCHIAVGLLYWWTESCLLMWTSAEDTSEFDASTLHHHLSWQSTSSLVPAAATAAMTRTYTTSCCSINVGYVMWHNVVAMSCSADESDGWWWRWWWCSVSQWVAAAARVTRHDNTEPFAAAAAATLGISHNISQW